jgi:hypothetical protein
MKVYLVEWWAWYETSTLVGIFSTKEKAEAAAAECRRKNGVKERMEGGVSVEEIEVDKVVA